MKRDKNSIVGIVDIEGNISFANKNLCHASGYTRNELVGINYKILKSDIHPHDYFKTLWQTVSNGKVWRGEICNLAKDGKTFWTETSIMPFLDEMGSPYKYIIISSDITEQKSIIENYKIKKTEIKSTFIDPDKSHQQQTRLEELTSSTLLSSDIENYINKPIQLIEDNTRFLQSAFEDISVFFNDHQKLIKTNNNGTSITDLTDELEKICQEVEMKKLITKIPKTIKQTLERIDHINEIALSMKDFTYPSYDKETTTDGTKDTDNRYSLSCEKKGKTQNNVIDFSKRKHTSTRN